MSLNSASRQIEVLISALDKELDQDRKFILKPPPGPNPNSSEPIIFSDELKYLNSSWGDWASFSEFTSHRPIIGGMFSFLKRKLQSYLFNVLFKDYFEKERQFNIRLVQYCNLTARYIDSRNQQIFWDLVNKLDKEIEQVNHRNDVLVSELANRIIESSLEVKKKG